MDDRLDAVLPDELCDQRLIAGFAQHERHALGDRPVEPGRQVVEHDGLLARRDQRIDHVAADVSGAAGDQDRHEVRP